MKPPSFASNSRLSAELMEATSTAAAVTAPAATTEGAAGGWWSAMAAAAAAMAASVAAAAAAAAAWHATRAGARRVVHGAGSAARNAVPCCLPTRLYRVHDCSGAATEMAWMTAVMSAPDMAPPLAAAASALVIDGEFRLGQRPVDARGTGSRRTARYHPFLALGGMAKKRVSAGTVSRGDVRRRSAVRPFSGCAPCTCRRLLF